MSREIPNFKHQPKNQPKPVDSEAAGAILTQEAPIVDLDTFTKKKIREHTKLHSDEIEHIDNFYDEADELEAGVGSGNEELEQRIQALRDEAKELEQALKIKAQTEVADEVAAYAGIPQSLIPPLQSRVLVKEELGRGAMGAVFLAEHILLQKPIALKLIRSRREEFLGSQMHERFQREVQSLAKLDHPNVMKIFAAHDSDEGAVFLTELLPGQNLREYEEAYALGPTPAPLLSKGKQLGVLDIFIQVARGLQATHEAGVVHRDVKPANIMITDKDSGHVESRVKLIDFGLVKPANEIEAREMSERVTGWSPEADAGETQSIPKATETLATNITATGMTIGTPRYISPEAIEGKTVEPPADIFGTGSMLYELLTRKPAFAGRGSNETMSKIRKGEFKPVLEEVSVPVQLDNLVSKMLYKDPKRRPTAAQVEQELLEIKHELESVKKKKAVA